MTISYLVSMVGGSGLFYMKLPARQARPERRGFGLDKWQVGLKPDLKEKRIHAMHDTIGLDQINAF